MTLQPGTQLGPYEILSQVGAGGMGEVYSAKDSKLGREVAIKVLPEAFSQDPERLARFQREACLLASLNHTNIATIYGIEESADTHYLVMELVPGDTLAERIKRDGAVPVEEALGIATQIAEALEHAHEYGIIHRDLKPANVKVTPEGQVKVLDFGLAKAFSADGTDSADTFDSNSPTILTGSPTMPGVILGTAAYMSPEQAKGKAVDKRTDIWAFGCVLYELFTGKQVFSGEDVTDIIAGIVKGEPDWKALPSQTSPLIRSLLRRCLQKDKNRRSRDAAEIRLQIEEAQAAPGSTGLAVAIPTRPLWRRSIPLVLTAVVAVIITGLVVWNLKPSADLPQQPLKRFAINLSTTDQLMDDGIALSRDGNTLVYVARRGGTNQLFRRSMEQQEISLIPGTEGARSPFFSPDGQWVGFFAENKLKKAALAGGPFVTICDAPGISRGASWGSDDTILFSTSGSAIFQVSAAGGIPQPAIAGNLVPVRSVGGYMWPDILPGSKAVLFTIFSGVVDTAQIAVQSLETGDRRILVAGTYPRFTPTGHIVFARSGSLWAVPFDADRLELTGEPVPVVEGVQVDPRIGFAQFALAADGSLVYVPGSEDAEKKLVWVGHGGSEQTLAAPPRSYANPRLSPDGRLLALDIAEGSRDVWVYDISRETLTRLTFEGQNQWPTWTPDGNHVTFSSARGGTLNLFWKPADGSGAVEQLTTSEYPHVSYAWSPDGKVLAFVEANPISGSDVWVLPMEGERKPRLFLQTPFYEGGLSLSPDGRWVAYTSNESGRFEVYMQSFPEPGGKRQISTQGGVEPVWARSGRELFYRNGDRMMAVEITTEPSFSAVTPRLLFEGPYDPPAGTRANYDVSPDGQRFLMIKATEQEATSPQINVVLNWFEELKERVPTGN